MNTLFDGLVGEVEVGLDVLVLEVKQREHHMRLLGWNLQVLQSCSGGDDGPDSVLGQ